jgi:hypothetical protein
LRCLCSCESNGQADKINAAVGEDDNEDDKVNLVEDTWNANSDPKKRKSYRGTWNANIDPKTRISIAVFCSSFYVDA